MEKYTKVRSIGEGAFGKALLVKDKGSGQQYVVKEIPMLRMKAKEREDARKEVSVLAQLHHPNIVRYRESFEEKGYLHIVMDFCEKGDLYHKISSQRGILFPEDQVMDWFVQISLAIKYVHDRKILHRDIKTQNIFLTSGGTIQLGDFGIAKVLGSTVELARTCIGTPYYLSPEICENRPYNNKSDVWSLGCVLYEMATLKHAFEAGNMKNLVLKIIRGSYPPLSPKYSYDLRGLIAKLFKRTPRDRPSVNSILKIPFVQRRVPKFLTDDQIADEFSHTIMHGHKLGNKIKIPTPSPASRPPSANRPPSAGVRRPLPPKPTPAVAPKKYNPANIYGTPVGRKSNDNRSSNDKRRPGSGSGSRPASSQQDLAKRKQDFIEKEKKRREEIQKAAMEKKHKDLMEKQKANRMNKAKEEGWKHVIGSLSSDDSDNREYSNDSNQAQNKKPVPRPAAQVPNNRGDYADYHAYLDKLDRDRNNRQNAPAGAAYMAAPRQPPIPNWNRAGVPRAPAATPIQQAEQNRQLGADAAERAKIVGDFIQRKKEAEMNKKRGNAELFGGAAPFESPRPGHTPSPMRDDGRPSSAEARNREEQEYLERLKKIRQANYMDRKNDKNSEADARKKKIEALRQQADDRAKQLREQLERQRRELFNKEERMRGQQVQRYGQGVNRPGSAPTPRPVPAVGMTGALKAIGSEPPQPEPVKSPPGIGMTGALKVIGSEPPQPEPVKSPPGIGMTGALKAIGAQNSPEETRPKSALQLKREEVLKGLNQRGPPRGAWGAPAEKPVIDIKEEEEEPESARSKWGEKLDDRLKELPLAETASAMEVTSARDQVIVNPGDVGADAASRRQWGRPGSTIMNALKEIPIMEGGSTMSSDKSDDSVPSSTASTEAEQKPGIGETITITKSSIHKGTITISSTENKAHVTRPEIELPAKPPISESESPEVNQSKSEPKITSSADEKTTQSKTSTEKEPEKSSSEGKLSKPPVANKPVFNKPPLPSKPVPAEKPLVLPKPTLLVKPDSPMSFAKQGQVPQEVNVMGEGSLFSRVELESEDTQEKPSNEAAKDNLVVEEIQDDIPKDKDGKPHSGMAMALTTGHFDIRNTGLLRTCSEPDLSKLSKEDVTKEERRSLDLELNNENDIDDEVTPGASPTGVSPTGASPTGVSPTGASPTGVSPTGASPTEDKEQDKPEEQNTDNKEGEDDDEDIDEEEYEDLMSVRETMASLLIRECSTDDDNSNKVDTGKFRLSLASSCSREDNIEEENDGNDDKEDKTPDEEDENGDKDEEGDENGEKDDEDKVDENGENDELNNYAEALEEAEFQDDSSLFESDESDADTQFGDDEDNYDLFSRLEESRAELENEMGCDKFLKIYKTVQALQEDEDENIEEGARLAMNMLGKEYEHLYPKIFQLVMADAAFTEDNI